VITGTVTISLKDYHDLLETKEKADDISTATRKAARELAVFLTFMATRKDIEPHVQEFNRQSTTSKIIVEDGRARVMFSDD
tara:strand:+ start:433 stop:675 length:243 start_codon:yes stop_codon:yes gene_type:complete